MVQSSNPFYVQPVDLGQATSNLFQGLQFRQAREDRERAIAAQQAQMQRESDARKAFAGLSGLPTEEDLMSGYNDQVPPQAQSQSPDQGGVPLMSAQNKPKELTPIDMEKLLPTDLNHIMNPQNASTERAALDGINHSSENHDDMVSHADQILNAPDNKKGAVVKGIIDQIVANGGDATPYAQLLRMSPTDAANHVKVARDLMERDYIRKIAANDPEMAYKIMQDKIQQRKNDIAQQKADAYQQHMLQLAERSAGVDGADSVHGHFITDKGTIGVVMKSGKVVDTGQRTNSYVPELTNEPADGASNADPTTGEMPAPQPGTPRGDSYWDAVASYKIAPPTGLSAQKPENKAGMRYVLGKNPTYSTANYKNLQSLDSNWANGKKSDAINTFSTAVSHLYELKDLASKLDNTDSQWVNKVANKVSDQFGDPTINSYEAAAPIVADEVTKAAIGAAGGVNEREQNAIKMLGSSKTPEQFNKALDTVIDLMGGKLNALKQQHDKGYESLGQKEHFRFEDRLTGDAADLFNKYQSKHQKQPAESHDEAIRWAQSHPDDPRAAKILKLHGM